jgi:membrane protease YdiL (CAAX protease family)
MGFRNLLRRSPLIWYFIGAFSTSWIGALILAGPKLVKGQHLEKMDGIHMFPVMIVGPPICAILLTIFTEGREGLRNFWSRLIRWKVSVKWYLLAIFIPISLSLATLAMMQRFISPAYAPHIFAFGFLFGIPAGLLEELGWTGYAFRGLRLRMDLFASGITLGALWAVWHIPVVDFLGAASPHGKFLFLFFLSFSSILVAMRILVSWVYENTHSVLLTQIMHTSSTGCLASFGPVSLSPGQESLWYASYSLLLWIVVLVIFIRPAISKGRNSNSAGASGTAKP